MKSSMTISGILLMLVVSCEPSKKEMSSQEVAAYTLTIDSWHQDRVKTLLGPTGWLNVSGLFWLNEGISTFGSGGMNDVVFPAGKITSQAGSFILDQGTVTMEVVPEAGVTLQGRAVKRVALFHPDSTGTTTVESGSLQWFIIKRNTKYGVRLRDFSSSQLKQFKEIDRYEVDPSWRFDARFEEAKGRTISITNVLGQTLQQSSPGTLVFTVAGKEYRLDALDEGEEELFIIYGDVTNAKETYGAGRYLYVKKPDAQGLTEIDFNKGYNPPCAFTEFATCPLPPRQNMLDLSVTAGEKNYSTH